jgi:hypothetical protein
MERQIFIASSSDKKEFETLINEYITNGWLPHWETFQVCESNEYLNYYMILEKKMDVIL